MNIERVNGIIIGEQWITGRLYRDGIEQSPAFIGDTDEEVREQAIAWFESHGGKRIWPNGLELRLYG